MLPVKLAGLGSYLPQRIVASAELEEQLAIPHDLDYGAIGSLSNEVREKLSLVQPRTLGQAGRIEGMTPGALTALLSHVKRTKVPA